MINSKALPILAFGIYAILSKILFDEIYLASNLIVDEEFHLPLGKQYCLSNFAKWDQQVTTLPGLYLISASLLGPLGLCSIYWLRAISLLFSYVNLVLFYLIFSKTVEGEWQKVCSALMMNLLPPLYFFSHVYYTDIVSLTGVLVMIMLNEKGDHYNSSIAGLLSVLCRQTNVVFVAIYGGRYMLTELYRCWVQRNGRIRRNGNFPIERAQDFFNDLVNRPMRILRNTNLHFWLNSNCYMSVIFSFLIFVHLNDGIVVGDRNAHHVSINIPQIFYFSLFCLIFGWPHFVVELPNFIQFTKRHRLFIQLVCFIAFVIIRLNTVVHPYLLADNRHLVFYVWNRSFGKFWWFKFALIPVYIFALYVIIKTLWDKRDISFFLMYSMGVVPLLVTQSLLELRYFLIPYIILRLRMKTAANTVFNVVLEFVTYSVINMVAFNIFFTRTFYWSDMINLQRIIW